MHRQTITFRDRRYVSLVVLNKGWRWKILHSYFKNSFFPPLVALQKQCDCGRKFTSEEEVEEDGEDTEEDIAIVHPDVGNEV